MTTLDHSRSTALATGLKLTTAATLMGLVLVGCATSAPSNSADPGETDAPHSEAPHGYVEGASEAAEPQVAAVFLAQNGEITSLDLLSEQEETVEADAEIVQWSSDRRYAAFLTAEGAVQLYDSGRWSVDHEDHMHFYRATPRTVEVPLAVDDVETLAEDGLWISSSERAVVVGVRGGATLVLDAKALGQGETDVLATLEESPGEQLTVPLGEHLVQASTEDASIEIFALDGSPIETLAQSCTNVASASQTPVGVVFSCDEGAVTVAASEKVPSASLTPMPDSASEPAGAFAGRSGRPTLAASNADGVWLFQSRSEAWTLVPTELQFSRVFAVDDTRHSVIGVTVDNEFAVVNGETGATVGVTETLLADSSATRPSSIELIATADRAYLFGPSEQQLWEIDFRDDARIARTFETPADSEFMVAGL
ncbi:hypothetical protein [Humidisolicoccus flavus]|uniref:hypothetical protein n=1 Tax=Humidisolicoccus flavus TaxID=3111414 RepID=UPI00324BD58E